MQVGITILVILLKAINHLFKDMSSGLIFLLKLFEEEPHNSDTSDGGRWFGCSPSLVATLCAF